MNRICSLAPSFQKLDFVRFLQKIFTKTAVWNLAFIANVWAPACAGMTIILAASLPANAETIMAKYEASWNGMVVGSMNVMAKQSAKKYEYRIDIKSEGLPDRFVHYRSENTSKGVIKNGKPSPQSYFTQWWRKKEHQQIKVAYKNGGKNVQETANPPEKRPKRPIVPPEFKNNTQDTVSSAFFARAKIRELAEAGASFPQKFTMPVFDARRRFDVTITINGYKSKKYDGKKQELLEVVFFRTPVNGFNEKELNRLKEQDPTITFYLNNDFIPLFGTGKAPFGQANFELTHLCITQEC